MIKLKKDVLFDNQNSETKKLLKSLGFKEGDNLSEITENFLKKQNRDLSYYFDNDEVKALRRNEQVKNI